MAALRRGSTSPTPSSGWIVGSGGDDRALDGRWQRPGNPSRRQARPSNSTTCSRSVGPGRLGGRRRGHDPDHVRRRRHVDAAGVRDLGGPAGRVLRSTPSRGGPPATATPCCAPSTAALTWTPDTTGNEYHVNQDVVFTSATHGFIVEQLQRRLDRRRDGPRDRLTAATRGRRWSSRGSATSTRSRRPAGRTVAVGSSGAVYVQAGTGAWGRVGSGPGYRLDSISMATGARGWACGYNGTVWRTGRRRRHLDAADPAGLRALRRRLRPDRIRSVGLRPRRRHQAHGRRAASRGPRRPRARRSSCTTSTSSTETRDGPWGRTATIVHTVDGGDTWTPAGVGRRRLPLVGLGRRRLHGLGVRRQRGHPAHDRRRGSLGPAGVGDGQWLGDITFVDAHTGWAVGSEQHDSCTRRTAARRGRRRRCRRASGSTARACRSRTPDGRVGGGRATAPS